MTKRKMQVAGFSGNVSCLFARYGSWEYLLHLTIHFMLFLASRFPFGLLQTADGRHNYKPKVFFLFFVCRTERKIHSGFRFV
jgi:hypothetical protein